MWTKEHTWSQRDVELRRLRNARVRIKDNETSAFGKRQRIARTGTISVTPRTATIRNRGLQTSNAIVAVDAGDDLTGNIRDVAEELAVWIPARLWRSAERVAVDVCEDATIRSKRDRIRRDCRRRRDFAPHQHRA